MRDLIARQEFGAIEVDSAGTGSWHVGDPPDSRAVAAAAARGVALGGSARKVRLDDFASFELIIAMDRANYSDLLRIAPSAEAAERVRLLREFDPEASGDLDVPDPYYSGNDGFDDVLDIVARSCSGLLESLRPDKANRPLNPSPIPASGTDLRPPPGHRPAAVHQSTPDDDGAGERIHSPASVKPG